MTYWHHVGSRELRVLPAKPKARPLSRGLGLAIGATASLGLWAGLIHVVLRLVG
jgi:hypothetical protein